MNEKTHFKRLTSMYDFAPVNKIYAPIMTIGKVVNMNKSQFITESIVYDEQERDLGRGMVYLFVANKN